MEGKRKPPDWISIYFVKVELGFRCNVCEEYVKAEKIDKNVVNHLKTKHVDIFNLHKDNPAATVGFRIEFLNLAVDKQLDESHGEQVVIGEVCEEITSDVIEESNEMQKPGEASSVQDEAQLALLNVDVVAKHTQSRKRSWVWKYFDRLSAIIYQCNICNVILSIKGSNTNNMNRHVKSKHPDVYVVEANEPVIKTEEQIISKDGTPYVVRIEEITSENETLDKQSTKKRRSTQSFKRSWVWDYFEANTPSAATCLLCRRSIVHGGNATGNMNRHLKMIHRDTYNQVITDKEKEVDTSWVWKVFESEEDDFYSCKICQYKCFKFNDLCKTINYILRHLKIEHGVISGNQIVTGIEDDDVVTQEDIDYTS